MTPEEYYKLRNEIYSDLVSCGVISDEDENYTAFDQVLSNNLDVNWES